MADVNLNKAYQWAIDTCNDANVRYSQAYRNQRTINGLTYYDCSSFIWYALVAGGFDCSGAYGSSYPFTTATMRAVLVTLGFSGYDATEVEWLAGDIVWREGHTEMVYQGTDDGGYTMGAHSANYSAANQVSINTTETAKSKFTFLYRYGDGGASGYGYSAYVVAAICGNFWQESTINPGVWEGLSEGSFTDTYIGYGLGQWTNTTGSDGRLYQLYTYLTENGYDLDDGYGQLAFLIYEATWYSTEEASDYATLDDFLNSTSTDIEALTHAFNRGWEGIHDSSWDDRVEYAQTCYDYIIAHANDTSITSWITGNRYLSTSERLNNAVMIYRWLSAGGGGGGTYTSTGFDLWMMCSKKVKLRKMGVII